MNQMGSSKFLTAEAATSILTKNISSGMYRNRFELNSHIRQLGLFQTRDGLDYIGAMASDGKRLRLYLEEPLLRDAQSPKCNTARQRKDRLKFRPAWSDDGLKVDGVFDGFAVYVLAAVHPDGCIGGYVGSTNNLSNRLTQHIEQNHQGKASFELKLWARENGATLYAKQIAAVPSRALACLIEGLITTELTKNGWHLPGVSRWIAYRRRVAIVHKAFGSRSIAWDAPTIEQIGTWQVLVMGRSTIELKVKRQNVTRMALTGTANHGQSWTEADRMAIAEAYIDDVDVNMIAARCERSKAAVMYQLMAMAESNDALRAKLDSGVGFDDD